ncbi:hypothetical protein [Synechococcus sp. M16CYN]
MDQGPYRAGIFDMFGFHYHKQFNRLAIVSTSSTGIKRLLKFTIGM